MNKKLFNFELNKGKDRLPPIKYPIIVINLSCIVFYLASQVKFFNTARPYGTWPYWTLTLMGHCFGLGPIILRYTVLLLRSQVKI